MKERQASEQAGKTQGKIKHKSEAKQPHTTSYTLQLHTNSTSSSSSFETTTKHH